MSQLCVERPRISLNSHPIKLNISSLFIHGKSSLRSHNGHLIENLSTKVVESGKKWNFFQYIWLIIVEIQIVRT